MSCTANVIALVEENLPSRLIFRNLLPGVKCYSLVTNLDKIIFLLQIVWLPGLESAPISCELNVPFQY